MDQSHCGTVKSFWSGAVSLDGISRLRHSHVSQPWGKKENKNNDVLSLPPARQVFANPRLGRGNKAGIRYSDCQPAISGIYQNRNIGMRGISFVSIQTATRPKPRKIDVKSETLAR